MRFKTLLMALLALALPGLAQNQNRFPPINLALSNPAGTACSGEGILQYKASLYICYNGTYQNAGEAAYTSGASFAVSPINPSLNATTGYDESALFQCTDTAFNGWNGGTGWTSASNNCLHAVFKSSEQGESLGNTGVGPGGWSVSSMARLEGTVNSPGISQILSLNQTKAGIGDTMGYYIYNWNYGGAVANSDEGLHVGALQGGESSVTFAGTVTRGGTGATSVVVNCTKDCGNQGDGRYLIRTQAPVAIGNIAAYAYPSGKTPGTVAISSAVTASKFWGTLNANVATPAGRPLGTGSTAMTFAVTQVGGASAPAAGDLICFAGQFHEQAKITSVTGSGPYTITANLRHAHEANSWVMDGGACGTFIDVVADQQTPNGQVLRYPIDVIGSTTSNTLVYRYFLTGNGDSTGLQGQFSTIMSLATVGVHSLTNTNGLVQFNATGLSNNPQMIGASSIYISNSTDPAFNGVCTNTFQGSVNYTLYCSQSFSIGHSSANATITFGTTQYGNTQFNLWAGAEVLDVQDYGTNPPSVDGHLTLEPNTVTWNTGDIVEQPHHYSTKDDLEFDVFNLFDPIGTYNNDAIEVNYGGAGIADGHANAVTRFAGMRMNNSNPYSIYVGHGGTLYPPGGYSLGYGLWDYGLQLGTAPFESMLYAGPEVNSNDPTQNYGIFWSANGRPLTYWPFQKSTEVGTSIHFDQPIDGPSVGGNMTFTTISAPQNNGSFARTGVGGNLADNTTYYYYVVAGNSAGGAGLRSTEFTVTTGSSGGKNTIRLLWTHPAGASGYAVCRGTRSETEQVIWTTGGSFQGYQNDLDDTGLTASGACPGAADASRGGIETADHVGIQDSTTSYEAIIRTAFGQTANRIFYLPVVSNDSTLAILASPAFTGTPTAPTQTTSDSSTDIATDAFVHNVVATAMPLYNVSGTVQTSPHEVVFSGRLSSGTYTVRLSGSAVYTSATSYVCVANDTTAAGAIRVSQASGSSFTLTGTSSDTFAGHCSGN